jgi:hypothetical protein
MKRSHRAISMKAWRVRKRMQAARSIDELLPCPDFGADIKKPSRLDSPRRPSRARVSLQKEEE